MIDSDKFEFCDDIIRDVIPYPHHMWVWEEGMRWEEKEKHAVQARSSIAQRNT